MLARTELCGDKTGASGGNVRSLTLGGNSEQVLTRCMKEAWDRSKLGSTGATKHPTYVR